MRRRARGEAARFQEDDRAADRAAAFAAHPRRVAEEERERERRRLARPGRGLEHERGARLMSDEERKEEEEEEEEEESDDVTTREVRASVAREGRRRRVARRSTDAPRARRGSRTDTRGWAATRSRRRAAGLSAAATPRTRRGVAVAGAGVDDDAVAVVARDRSRARTAPRLSRARATTAPPRPRARSRRTSTPCLRPRRDAARGVDGAARSADETTTRSRSPSRTTRQEHSLPVESGWIPVATRDDLTTRIF